MTDELGLDLERLLEQRGWLRALARSLVREDDADDLLQEAWLAALGTRTKARRSLRAWFTGLARNAAPGLRRPAALDLERERDVGELPATDGLVARAELQEHLSACVRRLREPYRSTVLLHYFEGLTLEEVGRRMGVPGSTVRTRLARALAELRGKLGRERETWGLLVAFAREGAGASLVETTGRVILMGTMLKVGGAALAAVLAFVLWTRLAAPVERESVAREAPAQEPTVAETSRVEEAAAPVSLTNVPQESAERLPAQSSPAEAEVETTPAQATVVPSQLERRLEAVADTFLTEDPDLAGLLALATALAAGAEEVPDSFEIKDESFSGKFDAGGNLKGTCWYRKGEYGVEFSTWNTSAPFPRHFSLEFTEEDGVVAKANLRVMSTPLRDPEVSLDGEEWIGWRAEIDSESGQLFQTTMKIVGSSAFGGKVVSHSYNYETSDTEGVEPRSVPWLRSSDLQPWLARLRSRMNR